MTVVILTVFCLSGVVFLGCFFLALCRDDHNKEARRSVEPLFPDALDLRQDVRDQHRFQFSSTVGLRPHHR